MKQGWKIKKLGEVCRYVKEQGRYTDLPYIGMEDIEPITNTFSGNLINRKVDSATFRFKPDFVLFGRLRPYLRKVFVPTFEGHCSTELFPIQTTPELKADFLKHWFMLDSTVSLVSSTCTGARMPRANMNYVLNFAIPIPSISEQERIVSILDSAFAKIEALRANALQNLQNSKDLFQVVLKQKLTPKHGWKLAALKQITSKIGSGATPDGGKENYKREGVSLIRSLNVHNIQFKYKNLAFIDQQQASKLRNVEVEYKDVLFNITGASVTRCCVVPDEALPARVNQHVAIIRPQQTIIVPKFLCFQLVGYYNDTLTYIANAGGSTRQAITKAQLEAFEIQLPNINEQQAIVEKLDSLSERCRAMEENYRQTLVACNDLKQALLKKAFNGEL